MKRQKPPTEKQRRASEINWMKARIVGCADAFARIGYDARLPSETRRNAQIVVVLIRDILQTWPKGGA